MSLSKKKEKVIVKKRKGIELLSEVALTEEAQYKKFSRRNEKEVEDDEEEKGDESIKTASNYASTNEEDETIVELKVENKAEGDEDKGMDYTTNQFNDDVDVRYSPTDAKIVSPIDVHVYHEVPSNQTPTLLIIPVSVITESSAVYTIGIPQSLSSFTPPPPQSTPTPPPTTKATNPLSALPNFTSVFQFNNRVSTLEKEVAKLKKDDLLNTQVTALVDEHLDSRLGATRDEFMSYLSASITAKITEKVKIQLP
ncbi:hypothetical protein Tco_0954236 [Tanacetum coccineum]|uniref:Uncharacterized protein n=1 Tax=Tanacetum coccineum TaxID=301880 RepID=A0ABQ5E259_9ASTR